MVFRPSKYNGPASRVDNFAYPSGMSTLSGHLPAPGPSRGFRFAATMVAAVGLFAVTLAGCSGGGSGGGGGGGGSGARGSSRVGTGQVRAAELTPALVDEATVLIGKLQRGERTYASLNDRERQLLLAISAFINERKDKRR